MDRSSAHFVRLWCPCLAGLIVSGCAASFSLREAREISCDRLLVLSEQGTTDHIRYMGSDFTYHYVFDERPGKRRSYKVRADKMKLNETFLPGEDSYVLHPWVIEGKPFGSKTEEAVTSAPPAEDDR